MTAPRAVVRALGWPARGVLLAVVGGYRRLVGPLLGPRCRFYPSCSAYAEGAIRAHGAAKGTALAVWRILRCSPLSAGGPDPVPERGRWRAEVLPGDVGVSSEEPSMYDSIAQGAR